MRVAFQIFGHLRTFERCAESLHANLLDRYSERDVFVHTWDRFESETVTHHERRCVPALVDDGAVAAVQQMYSPARLAVEPQSPREMGNLTFANGKQIAVSGVWYMLESMKKANQLREAYSADTGARYDVVVMVRPDIALRTPLDLDRFLSYARPPNVPDDETTRTRFAAFGPIPPILNDLRGLPGTDLLFFARPEVMTRVLAVADASDRYNMAHAVAPIRPRHLMNTYCADIGITTAIIDYSRPRDFDIIR